METKNELISVIVPVHNGARFLAQAINSVLVQSYNPVELIVVDDGSTDGSAAIAQGYGTALRYFHQPRSGVARARNHGIEQACGELIAFLDCDDLWPADKLERQALFMRSHQGCEFCVTRHRVFLEDGTSPLPAAWDRLLNEDTVARMPSALMVRAAFFERIGGFDEALLQCSDVDWFFRAGDATGQLLVAPAVLLYRRMHGANMTYDERRGHEYLLRVMRMAIHRRQQANGPTDG